uniref:CAP-Gly domain-containing protein n=1 Tax=Arion vulgaris TaxID=1028688 RepID=A0A0B6YSD5_9EUPU
MASDLNSALHEKNKDCNCEKCRYSWNRTFHNHAAELQHMSSEKTVAEVSLAKTNGCFKKGDRVLVQESTQEKKGDRHYPGTVQYVGYADDNLVAPRMHVGVCLYDNVYSSHNGVYQGKRYFFCPRGHGVMVKSSNVKPLSPVLRTWPLNGNNMFPSYEGVKKRRKLREKIIKEAEDKLCQEHEEKRRAQMVRVSRSATQLYSSDMASNTSYEILRYPDKDTPVHSDYLAKGRQNMDKDSFEELQLNKLKIAFGGDEKAERMVQTLRKLRMAFQEGLALEGKE